MQLLVTRPSYETWLVDTKLVAKEGNTLFVAAPNPFVAEMLEQRMYSLIAIAARQVMKNEDIEIEIIVLEAEESRNEVGHIT